MKGHIWSYILGGIIGGLSAVGVSAGIVIYFIYKYYQKGDIQITIRR